MGNLEDVNGYIESYANLKNETRIQLLTRQNFVQERICYSEGNNYYILLIIVKILPIEFF